MDKIHFWLLGFGFGSLALVYFSGYAFGYPYGLSFGAIGLGVRQWFMASAHAERAAGAISNKHVGAGYDKYHYHDIV